MAFKPNMVAAIREKQKAGKLPVSPMSPQNVMKQIPSLVPLPPAMSPLAPSGAMPGQPVAGMPRFGGLKKKLGRF